MRQPTEPKEFCFTDLLSADFFKRRPGRPRLPSWDDLWLFQMDRPPSWDDIYGADAWRGPLPQRGGKPPGRERNQSLIEGYRAAESQAMTMRAFAKQWYRERHGRDATLDDVLTVERQIARLSKK
jgi:hypothetical protein